SASSKARRVFSAPSAASPRWAMRRGLGPGRNREGTARPRSALLLVDEGILFLLVLAPAPAADRAAGAMVWGAARGLRRGGGPRRGPGTAAACGRSARPGRTARTPTIGRRRTGAGRARCRGRGARRAVRPTAPRRPARRRRR